MQTWIQHIASNSAAYNDFHRYIGEAVTGLNKALADAVRGDRMEEARGLAHELMVYENLQKAVSRQVREHNAQVTYINENKGG